MKRTITLIVGAALFMAACTNPGAATLAPSESTPAVSATTTSAPPTATATAAPPTPTTASSPTPDVGIGGPCDHPYFPLRVGSTWSYQASTGSWTTTVTGLTAGGANIHLDFGNLTLDEVITCNNGSIIIPFGSAAGFNLNGTGLATITVTGQSGVFLPPADQVAPGDTWTATYDLEGKVKTGSNESNFTAHVTQTFKAVDKESVTVAAGDFNDALKVSVDSNMQMKVTVAGTTVDTPIDFPQTTWFVPDVGWVKSTVDATTLGAAVTTELTAYHIP